MFLHKSYEISILFFDQISDFFKNSLCLNNNFLFFHVFLILPPSWAYLGPGQSWYAYQCFIFGSPWCQLGSAWSHLGQTYCHPGSTRWHLGLPLVPSWPRSAPFPLNSASPRADSAPHRFNFAAYWQSLALSWRNLVQFWSHLAQLGGNLAYFGSNWLLLCATWCHLCSICRLGPIWYCVGST